MHQYDIIHSRMCLKILKIALFKRRYQQCKKIKYVNVIEDKSWKIMVNVWWCKSAKLSSYKVICFQRLLLLQIYISSHIRTKRLCFLTFRLTFSALTSKRFAVCSNHSSQAGIPHNSLSLICKVDWRTNCGFSKLQLPGFRRRCTGKLWIIQDCGGSFTLLCQRERKDGEEQKCEVCASIFLSQHTWWPWIKATTMYCDFGGLGKK